MGENSQSTIQWGVGIICALIMAYMLYVSGGPERSYDIVAILGMLSLIAILLGYQELLVRILQVWRGNSLGSSDSNDQSKRNDEERSELTQQILKDIRREQQQRQRSQEQTNNRMETKTKTNNDEQES